MIVPKSKSMPGSSSSLSRHVVVHARHRSGSDADEQLVWGNSAWIAHDDEDEEEDEGVKEAPDDQEGDDELADDDDAVHAMTEFEVVEGYAPWAGGAKGMQHKGKQEGKGAGKRKGKAKVGVDDEDNDAGEVNPGGRIQQAADGGLYYLCIWKFCHMS
jgi:hypothetical protein